MGVEGKIVIQQVLNGMLTLMLAKFMLNDAPHMLEQSVNPIYSEDFLNFMTNKVATTKYLKVFSKIDVDKVLDNIRILKPKFASLLNIYYHIATERATLEEVDIAFKIVGEENSLLLHKYARYAQARPTGKCFAELVGAVKQTAADIEAARTRSDKVLAVDRFMAVTHGMIVDRWEGQELSGKTYPLPFNITNKEAEVYREYLDVLAV